MIFRLFSLLTSITVIACSSDNGTKVVNSNPEATITYPSDGEALLEGYTIVLRGTVSDDDHSADQLTVSWNNGAIPLCEAAAPESDGAVQCEIVVTEEISEISLQVQDPNNAAGLDTVTVSVTPTEAPSIIVNSPTATGAYYSDQLILFSAVVSDGEDPPEELSVLWSSSLDGELPITALPDSSGTLEQYLNLTEGQHAISVTVEDTSGKTATETVAITVGGPNSEPLCGIDTPQGGAAYIIGQNINFTGTATDEDINNSNLSISWESNRDGVFDTTAANTAGELGFSYDGLSAANHTITLRVEDEVGGLCTDTVQIAIGNPPSLSLNSPLDGSVYSEGAVVNFAASVSDTEDIASDIALSWESSIDGEISTQGANSNGNISFSSSSLSVGTHSMTVTATDTTGLTDSASFSLRINSEPVIDAAASISPNTGVVTGTTLTCSATITDAEEGALTPSYDWSIGGASVATGATFTLNSSNSNVGDSIVCTATASDSDGQSVSSSTSVTVENSLPTVSNVTITPANASNTDTLSCTATATDPDESVTVSYAWSLANGQSLGSGSSLDLSQTSVNSGDEVICTASTADSNGGTASGTASIIIANTAPTLSLSSPLDGSLYNLGQSIPFAATVSDPEDAETDIDLSWSSSIDGEFSTQGANSSGNISFSSTALSAGVHSITVTATDSAGDSDSVSIALTINTPPTSPTVSISPSNPLTGDSLTASASGSVDAEGAAITYGYAWYQNGNLTSYLSNTVPSSATSVGEQWTVRVTPNDGNADGAYTESSVIVVNSAPTVDSISIAPNTGVFNDTTLSCAAVVSDADETVSASYEWTVNGLSYAGATLDLSSTNAKPTDSVICTATVTDSEGDSDSQSTSVVVENREPSVSGVSTSPSVVYSDSEVSCSGIGSDADGENVSLSIEWSVGGNSIGSGTPLDLTGLVGVGDVLTCTVTGADGYGGTNSSSATVTVSNTDPMIDSIALTPSNPTATDVLDCSAVASDVDGGTPTLTFSWENVTTGASYSSTSSNLDSASLDLSLESVLPGDEIACMVDADDVDGGSSSDMAVAMVVNTAPYFDAAASISPNTGVVTGSTLTCSASATDLDDGSIAPTFEWTIGGSSVGPGSTFSVSSSNSNVGDTIMCTATATDTDGETATSSASVTVENTSPVLSGASLTPSTVYNDTVVSCNASVSDPDETVTPSIEWFVAGQSVGTGSSIDLATTAAMSGDTVDCVMSVSDSNGGSDSVTESATVQNRAPVVSSVSISPSNPVEGVDDAVCSAIASDPDGDVVLMSYDWIELNGATGTGDTLNASLTIGGEVWTCTATASDGTASDSDTATVVIDSIVTCAYGSCDTALDLGNGVVMDLNLIPAGDDPLQRYTLTRDFFLMTTEVTQEMFQQIMGYDSGIGESTVYGNGGDFSAYYVNWHMAAAFANAVTQRHNTVNGTNLQNCYSCLGSGTSVNCSEESDPYQCNGYVLPSRAEWEYAARSGTTSDFWTGEGPNLGGTYSSTSCGNGINDTTIRIQDGASNPALSDYAWFCGNQYDSTYYNMNKPVGLKIPNGFGLYDMHGNVMEWNGDWSCSSYQSIIDPYCGSGSYRYLSGGRWYGSPSDVKVSINGSQSHPSSRGYYFGFRIARHPSPGIFLSPTSPVEGIDDIICVIDMPSTNLNYNFDWVRDGQIYLGSKLSTNYVGDTIPASETVEGENWECTVTENDGIIDINSTSVDVTVVSHVNCNASLGSMSLNLGGGEILNLNLIPGCREPLGRYTLTQDFYLMTTEVTQGMFQRIMGYDSSIGQSAVYGNGGDFPAYYVNWHMAAAFANAVTQRHNTVNGTNLQNCYNCYGSGINISCSDVSDPYQCTGYVLPTEIEWEYAARSGTTSDFWTIEGIIPLGGTNSANICSSNITIQDGINNPYLGDYGWFCGNSGSASHEVGLNLPNGFGLYDMHGNVSEWTNDKYGCYYPQFTCGSGSSFVHRGGNWGQVPDYMQTSFRNYSAPIYRNETIGFRIGLHP